MMLSGISTIGGITGAYLLAFGFPLIGYIFFLIGSIAAVIYFIPRKEWAMLIQFAFFSIANIIGLFRAII